MSRTKLSLLAGMTVLVLGAGLANPVLAADTQAGDTLANDLLKIQGTVGSDQSDNASDPAQDKSATPANNADQTLSVLTKGTPDKSKPAKKHNGQKPKTEPSKVKAEEDAPADLTSVPSAAPLLQPDAAQSSDLSPVMGQPPLTAPASTDASSSTANRTFLDEMSSLQQDIVLLKLKNEKATLQDTLDKTTGVAQQRAAAVQAASAPVVEKTEPEDKPENLPGVSAIFGAKGENKVELSLPSGGLVVARAGDVVPGGWKLSKIEDSAVYVTSERTGKEFVLGAGRAPGTAISNAPKAKRSSKPSGETSDKPNVVLAPAK